MESSGIIEIPQSLLNFLDANPELKQNFIQHLDKLNALMQSTVPINNATFDSIEETYNKISSINETKFFREKYIHVKKTLTFNIKKLKLALKPNKRQQQIKPQQEQLNQLNSFLAKLFYQVSELNNQELPFLQLKEIEKNINESMNNINDTLQMIGLTDLKSFQADTSSNDYKFIHDSLDETIAKAQDQKKIVKNEINQCKFSKESTEDIIERYKIPEILSNDIMLKNESQITEINGDQYKEGQYYNKNNDSIDLTLMTLSNDNICYLDRILDVFTKIKDIEGVESIVGYTKENGQSYTIITKSGGENLFGSLCHRSQKDDIKKLTSKDKTILAIKIAFAMANVHSKNVIHRNLSTRFINFYYNKEGVIFPIITNFRYSRSQTNNNMEYLTCYKDMPLKISNFLAPEFYSGGNYNQSIDVFSFGVILYELLTESTPYEQCSAHEIYKKLLENELPSFDKFNENKDLADLIKKCWSIKPEDRPTFNDILHEMSENKIVIRQNVNDGNDKNEIDNLYAGFKVEPNPMFKNCLDCIETIQDDISKSVHFRNQLQSTALFIRFFLNCLKNHQPEKNDANYRDIYDCLIQYKELINKYGPEIVPETSPKFIEIDITTIPKKIEEIINNIDDSMRNIGYANSQRYALSLDDFAFDFHALYMAFLGDKNSFSIEVIQNKYNEIKHYIHEKCSEIDLRRKYFDAIKADKFNKEFTFNKIDEYLGSLYFYNKDLDQSIKIYDQLKEINENDNIKDIEGEDINEPSIRLNLEGLKVLYQSRSSLVYTKVMEDNHDCPYAYKVFHGRYLSLRKENLMLLKKEIELNALVKNKYIAKFQMFSLKNLKNDCYVVLITECGQKGTLRQVLDDKVNKLTDYQKTTIAAKIACAMRYLAERNIGHHDLTPENIVIDSDFNPKIIDFGQATIGSQDLIGVTDGTAENQILDNRDDLFSFSRILYEMYKGEKIQNVRNFKFEKDDKKKSDLEELIELGFRTDEKTSFEKIYYLMTSRNIAFPEANNEEVANFYKSLSSEVLSP